MMIVLCWLSVEILFLDSYLGHFWTHTLSCKLGTRSPLWLVLMLLLHGVVCPWHPAGFGNGFHEKSSRQLRWGLAITVWQLLHSGGLLDGCHYIADWPSCSSCFICGDAPGVCTLQRAHHREVVRGSLPQPCTWQAQSIGAELSWSSPQC